MRTITAAQQGVLDSGVQAEFVRVSVKDSGGTFRDLTTYPGFNAVKTVSWSERIDDPHMTCDIALTREMYKLSLSPYMTASALNRAFNPAASFNALIAMTREVKVEVAIVSADAQPQSGDWFEVFRGRIDDIDTASGYDVTLACRSLGGRLAQQYIKTEYVYSHATVAGVAVPLRVWSPQIPVVLNTTYCLPASRGTDDPGYDKFFKCSQSGTTGTNEPTWSTGSGIVDGTAKWDYVAAPTSTGTPVEQVMQNILNDHKSAGDPTVTLYTPTSPGWAIRQFIQQRTFVLDALVALAKQIGWDLRFKWRNATSQFELTFSQPERSSPSVNFTFSPSDYVDPTRLTLSIANIRNSWRVVYSDRSDLWPDGTPKRKVIEVSDSASIAKYGELWAEIQEDENSQIDSSTEATTLANAALSDCREPTAELSVPLVRGFPWVELNDYYTFTANGLHFDTNQSLAVTGWSQSFDNGRLKTTLDLRGLPTIGSQVWVGSSVHPKIPISRPPPLIATAFNGIRTANPAVIQEIGGFKLSTSPTTMDKAARRNDEAEVHVYTTSGQGLSDASLKDIINGGNAGKSFNGLVPGKQYYGRIVPRFFDQNRIVRGQPSKEFSIVAGRAKTGHYDSAALPGLVPLNGNFEHTTDDISVAPPDHWEVVANAFGDSFPTYWPSGASSGTDATKGRYITLSDGISGGDNERGHIRSSMFEVRRGAYDMNFYVSLRKSATSANANDSLWMLVECFTLYGGSVVSSASFEFTAGAGGYVPSPSTWYNLAFTMDPTLLPIPDNVNFIRISFWRGDSTTPDNFGSVAWDIGDVYCETTGQYTATYNSITVFSSANVGSLGVNNEANFYDAVYFNADVDSAPGSLTHVRGTTATAGSYASGSVIIFGTEDYDTRNEYNNSTGVFTAGIAGRYHVSAAILTNSQAYLVGDSVEIVVVKNGTAAAFGYRFMAPTAANFYVSSMVDTTLELAAGDTIKIFLNHSRSGGNVTLFTANTRNFLTIDRLI